MYAVIFKARIKQLAIDEGYHATAKHMREKAQSQYGCLDFISVSEGEQEISISYWPDLDSIKAWKQDADHLQAQRMGRELWYVDYKVEIVELKRSYCYPDEDE